MEAFGNYTYVVERTDYEFDVTVKTVADVTLHDAETHDWWHETGMPYEWQGFGTQGGTHIGLDFKGGVYVRFACKPWLTMLMQPGPNAPANSRFMRYWFGVMDTYITKASYGYCDRNYNQNPPTFVGMWAGIASENSHPPMTRDDGTYVTPYAIVPWDTNKVLDQDIANAVVVYLPFDLLAGAVEKWHGGTLGSNSYIEDVKKADVYVTYTVLVQGMVIKEFAASPPQPGESPPIKAPNDAVRVSVPSWWDQYGTIIIIAIIVVAIVLIAFAWIVGPGILLIVLTGGLFRMVEINHKEAKNGR